MEVTRELLEARRAQLVADQQQASLNYTALGGAIQDIEYWLAHLKQEEPAAETEIPNA
jgi:hypothetical protein